ncbi:MAG: hypothetical protein LIP10_03765 [Clostridiales bacterium]|nr:hypothetical protein [Clostridiales bacterium]
METVNMKKFKWEEKKREFKENARRKADKAATWMYANKETLVKLAPVAVVGVHSVTKIISGAQKSRNLKQEEEARRLNVYDPQNGQYCRLKRPLKNSEKVRLDDLRTHGYSVTRALDIMGLLD